MQISLFPFPSDSWDGMPECVYLYLHSQHDDSWLNLLLSITAGKKKKKKCIWICMRIFILTVSLFGVISGVYCECLLTCHRVWRCVTVLEYILVWCESVCGCINVCRAPPASLQAPLQKSSCTLQDASRACSSGERWRPSISWPAGRRWAPAAALHVSWSCSVQSDTRIATAREGGGERHNHWWWCGRAMRVVVK